MFTRVCGGFAPGCCPGRLSVLQSVVVVVVVVGRSVGPPFVRVHTHTHTHTYTHVQRCTHTQVLSHTHTWIHTCTYTHAKTPMMGYVKNAHEAWSEKSKSKNIFFYACTYDGVLEIHTHTWAHIHKCTYEGYGEFIENQGGTKNFAFFLIFFLTFGNRHIYLCSRNSTQHKHFKTWVQSLTSSLLTTSPS